MLLVHAAGDDECRVGQQVVQQHFPRVGVQRGIHTLEAKPQGLALEN